jgi:hypothetical protein
MDNPYYYKTALQETLTTQRIHLLYLSLIYEQPSNNPTANKSLKTKKASFTARLLANTVFLPLKVHILTITTVEIVLNMINAK